MRHLEQLPPWAAVVIALLVVTGASLTVLGGLGLVRLKSFYQRLHAPTLGYSYGTLLIVLASMLMFTLLEGRVVVHEVMIGIFIMATTPITLLMLGRAALRRDRDAKLGHDEAVPPRIPREDRPAEPRGQTGHGEGLEDAGLLAAPHSSAGRVPTAQGYRLFVDSLLQVKPLGAQEVDRLRSGLPAGAGTQALLGSTSELLAAMTHFAGMVSVPKRESFAFRQIDFVALDPQRVLAILVFADGEVQNRVVQVRRAFSPSELEQAANYLNAHFAGQSLAVIRAALLRELRDARSEMERLLASSLALAEQAFAPAREDDMVVAGQTRLLGLQELGDLDRLRALFEAFAEKRELLQLLERTAKAPGMRVFIGEETGLAPLEGMSLVTASYGRDGQVLGVLGVIGPSRMAYERVIPVVEATAALLGAALNPDP